MVASGPGLLLVDRYQAALTRTTRAAGRIAVASWLELLNLPQLEAEEAHERWLASTLPQLLTMQRATAQVAAAFVTTVGNVETGVMAAAAPIAIDDFTTGRLRGVPTEEVYRRPLVTFARALGQGKPFELARDESATRLATIARTDVQLAARGSANATMRDDTRVVGYRRTLSGAENCGLCVAASTQRYHTGELMPLHDRCDCAVAPIYGDRDPGQVIDRDTLRTVQANTASMSRDDLARARFQASDLPDVQVREHGELGPVLTNAAHHFTGPSDIR